MKNFAANTVVVSSPVITPTTNASTTNNSPLIPQDDTVVPDYVPTTQDSKTNVNFLKQLQTIIFMIMHFFVKK